MRNQGHIRESAKYAVGVNTSIHAEHHMILMIIMLMMMTMRSNHNSNAAAYIEKKMVTKPRDGLGQLILFYISET